MEITFEIQALEEVVKKRVSPLAKLFKIVMQLLSDPEYKNVEVENILLNGKRVECKSEIYKLNLKQNSVVFIESKINKMLIRQEKISYEGENSLIMMVNVSNKDIGNEMQLLSFKDWNKRSYVENLSDYISFIKINDKKEENKPCFKPNKEGEYKVEIFFNKNLQTCQYMFNNCTKITMLDLSNFNTSETSSMKGMFSNCSNLKTLYLPGINTSKVTDMEAMFYNCNKLEKIDGLEGINTENCSNFDYMFSFCRAMKELELETFNLGKLKSAEGMFMECCQLYKLSLNLSNVSDDANLNKIFVNVPKNADFIFINKRGEKVLKKIKNI